MHIRGEADGGLSAIHRNGEGFRAEKGWDRALRKGSPWTDGRTRQAESQLRGLTLVMLPAALLPEGGGGRRCGQECLLVLCCLHWRMDIKLELLNII